MPVEREVECKCTGVHTDLPDVKQVPKFVGHAEVGERVLKLTGQIHLHVQAHIHVYSPVCWVVKRESTL